MAKLCAFRQFVDAVGNPLASGKIYTYITGSTTPKATYTDSTEATAHPNPVILNSAGVADIWLKTDEAYKFIIKDSTGTQIGNTIDGIVPVTQLAAQTGGSNLDISGYAIITSANADLTLTPNGTGSIVLDGQKWPQADGSSGQTLTTGGTGQLQWSTPGISVLSGISDVAINSVANGNLLKYNSGTLKWENVAQSTLSVTASQVSDLATASIAFSGKTGNISQWTNDSSYTTNAAVATASIAFTNKTGAISQWTNDSGYLGTSAIAAKADMETATSTTTAVTPGRVQNHPGVAKAWARITSVNNSNPTINASHNVTSVVRNSEGVYTVTFTTAFSSTDYCCIPSWQGAVSGTLVSLAPVSTTTATLTTTVSNIVADIDGVVFNFIVFGDQ
jgi:hypothetical protein